MLYDRKRWEPKIPIVKPVKPRAKPELWQQVLRRAALYIKNHGWIRHRVRGSAGQVCILGALGRIRAGADGAAPVDGGEVYEGQCRFERHVGTCTVDWNDRVATSAKHVIKELRAAARGG